MSKKSGKTSKSPKLRERLKREAGKNDRKRKQTDCKYSTVAQAMDIHN